MLAMAFTNPQENLRYLEIESGMTVVDLGAGVGTYTLPIADKLLPNGKVYAVEIQKDFLETIQRQAVEKSLPNIHVVWGDIEQVNGVSLSDNVADRIVIADVLFQTKSAYVLATEARRLLKPDGKIMVIDWLDSFGGLGPKAEDIAKPEEIKNIFGSVGLILEKEFSAGEHHYGLIFSK